MAVHMTAHAMPEERQRCLLLGMNGHLSKPIDPDVLYAALADVQLSQGAARPGPVTSLIVPALVGANKRIADLTGIDGLDVDTGLRYANGNLAFYQQIPHRCSATQKRILPVFWPADAALGGDLLGYLQCRPQDLSG